MITQPALSTVWSSRSRVLLTATDRTSAIAMACAMHARARCADRDGLGIASRSQDRIAGVVSHQCVGAETELGGLVRALNRRNVHVRLPSANQIKASDGSTCTAGSTAASPCFSRYRAGRQRAACSPTQRTITAYMRLRVLRTLSSLKFRGSAVASLVLLCGVSVSTIVTIGAFELESRAASIDVIEDAAQRASAQISERIADRRDYMAAFARGVPPDISSDANLTTRILATQPTPPMQFNRTFVATPSGQVLASVKNGEVRGSEVDFSNHAFFQQLLNTRRGVTSIPFRVIENGPPVVIIAEPVLDDSGVVASVVGASLPLEGSGGLSEISGRINAQTKTIVIHRKHLTILGHPDPNAIAHSNRRTRVA